KLFANLSPPLPAPISPRPSPPSASEDEPRDKTARISPGSTSSLRCTRLPILSSPSSFLSAPPPSPPSVLVSFASYSLKSSSSMASIASQSITSSCASPSPSAAAASVVDGSTAIDCDVSVIDVFVATFVDEDVVVVVVVVVVRFVVCMIVPSTSFCSIRVRPRLAACSACRPCCSPTGPWRSAAAWPFIMEPGPPCDNATFVCGSDPVMVASSSYGMREPGSMGEKLWAFCALGGCGRFRLRF
uniref:Uncharacterized protein n=1 Tax=Glossina palpalis gambiensis TaxID=67801 RepID=A0A1B0B9J4_9MUSC